MSTVANAPFVYQPSQTPSHHNFCNPTCCKPYQLLPRPFAPCHIKFCKLPWHINSCKLSWRVNFCKLPWCLSFVRSLAKNTFANSHGKALSLKKPWRTFANPLANQLVAKAPCLSTFMHHINFRKCRLSTFATLLCHPLASIKH